jgi:uncharacterized protein (TIGR02145 family)
MELFGRYVDYALNEDVGVRKRFAEYFAAGTISKDLRDRWNEYLVIINKEFEQINDSINSLTFLKDGLISELDNVCPAGWHLPSDSGFEILSNYLGGPDAAGGKLKEAGTTHWNSPNTGATNSSGFTALASGRNNDNEYKGYLGIIAFFWSSNEDDSENAWGRALNSAKGEFTRYYLEKKGGISVHCLKDL